MPNDENSTMQPPGALDRSVQDFLGRKLRAAYNEVAEKPAYLGDPALPPEFEHQLVRIEATIRTHEGGVNAVREALDVTDPAHEQGIATVTKALGSPDYSGD
jgi:hypothetical protein